MHICQECRGGKFALDDSLTSQCVEVTLLNWRVLSQSGTVCEFNPQSSCSQWRCPNKLVCWDGLEGVVTSH